MEDTDSSTAQLMARLICRGSRLPTERDRTAEFRCAGRQSATGNLQQSEQFVINRSIPHWLQKCACNLGQPVAGSARIAAVEQLGKSSSRNVFECSDMFIFKFSVGKSLVSCRESNSHCGRRRDETRHFCRVGSGGPNWAWAIVTL